MADWMPTTDQVRSGYAVDPEGEYRDPINAASNERAAERAFNRWLEAHDRQVKADALREAADTVDANPLTVSIMTAWRAAEFLRAEADRIEKETDRG